MIKPQNPAEIPIPGVTRLPPGSRVPLPTRKRPGVGASVPRNLRPRKGGGYILRGGEFTAHIKGDGSFYFEDHEVRPITFPTVFAFDVTDTVMRALRDDPYLARKMAFIKETSELRASMRRRVLKEDLHRSVRDLRIRLEQLWGRPGLSFEDKRRLLFEIWDGVLETGDPARVRAGRHIRITLLGFIRRRLPPSSPHRYRPSELDRLNAVRTSSVAFRPYP